MKGKTQRKHNLERFPERFRFQLTDKEKDKTVAICDRFEHIKHSSVNPCVYTEQGVAMLSTVLRSETAVNTGNRIMFGFSLIGKDSVTIIDRVKNLI
jgi:hypothetical protein